MFARSSKRAFSSTRQTACLPRSVAVISDGTSGESSDVRYTVCLTASTSGSSTAWVTNRSTDAANDSYGWWTSRSPWRISENMSCSSASAASTRGGVTGVHGSSRSPGWPGSPAICHRSFMSSRPGIT